MRYSVLVDMTKHGSMPKSTTYFAPSTTLIGDQHRRRVRVMLWVASGLLGAEGIGWAVYFMQKGAWDIVLMDLVMMALGIGGGILTYLRRTRTAFFLMGGSIFLLVCGVSLVLDIPSAMAPRSTHHFLLVLAVASLLLLRDDRAVLRYLVTGSCFVAFVVLASTNTGFASAYALPDSVRIGGTWVNNIFAALGLYALIHIIVSDFSEHYAMQMDLRKGIARGEFFLVYQPQVTSEGRVVGAEALLRWQHPVLGLVPPDEFIPLAEQSGLIVPLGTWVLGAACEQLVDWSKRADMAALTLSVNVSAYQFRRSDFVQQVATVMERTGVSPRRLKLELTESALVHDMDDIIQKMVELKALGVDFSLDDFGTGYSSLSYLKRLPLDQLKIDKSFVNDVLTDPNDAAIAHMVIELGKNLGFSVIAEGVETQGQCDFLAQNGCHLFQGYLFCRPISSPQFTEYCLRPYGVNHD
jgi:EAL domain-containing protein (putative c-di-GMP-specific phosphodiesterase class I)